MKIKLIKKIVKFLAIVLTVSAIMSGCGCSGKKQYSAYKDSKVENIMLELHSVVIPDSAKVQGGTVIQNGGSNVQQNTGFDDAVFIGDSVTLSFSMYVDEQREAGYDCLGKAYVLSAGSLGYINSIDLPVGNPQCVLPMYQGEQQPLEDSVAKLGAKKVYIMLGMNDVFMADNDTVISYADTVMNRIKEKSPDVQFYVQSVTPIVRVKVTDSFNNETIQSFNEVLREYAMQHGYYYLDVYSVMADEEGYLKDEYCGDPDAMGIHFNRTADEAWKNYLIEHPQGI